MQTSFKTLTPVLVLALALTIAASAVAMPNMAPAAATPAAPATQKSVAISGRVAETFDSGGYTYVVVEKQGQRVWVASRPVKLVVGQEVAFKSGHVIRNFKSSTLGRTFDTIIFTQGLATPPAAPTAK
jgi:hypothetical protein